MVQQSGLVRLPTAIDTDESVNARFVKHEVAC
jgi:hypothetical protein